MSEPYEVRIDPGAIRIPDHPVPLKDEAGNVIGEATVERRDGDDTIVSMACAGPVFEEIVGGTLQAVSLDSHGAEHTSVRVVGVTEHVTDDAGLDGFTVVVSVPDGAWTQHDNGKPGWVEWKLFEISGGCVDDVPGTYMWTDEDGGPVDDLSRASVAAYGSVKWDGCCNWWTSGMALHTHDVEGMELFGRALAVAYTRSFELVDGL